MRRLRIEISRISTLFFRPIHFETMGCIFSLGDEILDDFTQGDGP